MARTTLPTVRHSDGSIQIARGAESPQDHGPERRVLEHLMIVARPVEMGPNEKNAGNVDKILHVEIQ